MDDLGVFDIEQITAFQQAGGLQQAFNTLGAVFGEGDVFLLFVGLEIGGIADQLLHDGIDRDVKIALVVGGAGYDQGRARLVDQDAVHLVHDGVIGRTVHHMGAVVLHIIAQIIKAQLVVGGIGDVAIIGLGALRLGHIGDDHADRQPQKLVDLPHPLGIALGQIVVDGDDMHALAFQRVQIHRQRRHQRLALASAHFGDLAPVQHDAANHLHIEMPHAQHALGGLAAGGKGLGQDLVQRLAIG